MHVLCLVCICVLNIFCPIFTCSSIYSRKLCAEKNNRWTTKNAQVRYSMSNDLDLYNAYYCQM